MITDAILSFFANLFGAVIGLFPAMPTTGTFVTAMSALSTNLTTFVQYYNYLAQTFPFFTAFVNVTALGASIMVSITTYKITMYVYSHLTRSAVKY